MTEHQFKDELLKHGIELTPVQEQQFARYYQLLIEWNEKMNLTAITNKEEVYEKHFYDSLTLAFHHKPVSGTLLDVGAGAGFPSIPLKIVFPDLKVYVLDSLAKRMTFVETVIKDLGLKDIYIIVNRAEDEAKNSRERFDIVTARAVAKLNILSELCLPLVKLNGYFIALKGASAKSELEDSSKAIPTLGGKVDYIQELNLLSQDDKRYNIFIKKINVTNKIYPRSYAKIKKNPL
jgi:16S rRNA (guanine527-N7)-methyltransferase